ncbi:hypothetical protein JW911_04465 [Candidatus Peregrinibacteria bacterium]|nr:hypothetical protein [Candidatus Peregrinibacteria bacterium]
MLKPKFNLFNQLFVYAVPRAPHGAPAVSSAPNEESNDKDKKLKSKKEEAAKEIGKISKSTGDEIGKVYVALCESTGFGMLKPRKDEMDEIKNLKEETSKEVGSFIKAIRTYNTPQEITALISKTNNRFKEIQKNAKELVELREVRNAMLKSLKKHSEDIKKEFLNKSYGENVEKKHLEMVLNAYLLRWQRVNEKALKNIPFKNIKLLKLHFDQQNGLFVKGKLVEELKDIKEQIGEVIIKWQADLARQVYKNSDWDVGFNAKFLPPLPDWGKDKTPGEFTSPLAEGSTEWSDYKTKLEREQNQEKYFEKLLSHAETLKQVLKNQIGGEYDYSKAVLDKKTGAVSFKIIKQGKEIGAISLKEANRVAQINLVQGTTETNITSLITGNKFDEIKTQFASLEQNALKPTVKEVIVDANSKTIRVKGENLPAQPIVIDITKGAAVLSEAFRSGASNVNLAATLKNLDVHLNAIVKSAIRASLSDTLKGQEDIVMHKISENDIRLLQESLFKENKPTINMTGYASMEGGLNMNLRIAKQRARAAKANLQVPRGYKVEMKGYIYGPNGEKIENDAQLKIAETKLLEMWNKMFAKATVKSAKEIYAKIDASGVPADQQKFITEHFNNARKATVEIAYPAGTRGAAAPTAPKLTLNYETAPGTAAPTTTG